MIPRAECDVAAAQAVTLATDRLADPAKRATTDRAFSECFFIAVWFTSRHEVNEMFKYQHGTCRTMRSKFLIQRGKISQILQSYLVHKFADIYGTIIAHSQICLRSRFAFIVEHEHEKSIESSIVNTFFFLRDFSLHKPARTKSLNGPEFSFSFTLMTQQLLSLLLRLLVPRYQKWFGWIYVGQRDSDVCRFDIHSVELIIRAEPRSSNKRFNRHNGILYVSPSD